MTKTFTLIDFLTNTIMFLLFEALNYFYDFILVQKKKDMHLNKLL